MKPAFGKGQTGNPNGHEITGRTHKAARKLTQTEFERICYDLMKMSTKGLTELVQSDKTPVLTALIARILEKGIHDSSKGRAKIFRRTFLREGARPSELYRQRERFAADFIAARNAMNDPKQDGEDDFK
ncbi:MAG: hypothetical protein IPK80_02435 [Nannocystis sp.]|nr:hypothetical protein [Nannocystis sp.]